MNKFSKKNWFIGGDLSKDNIDYCVVDGKGTILKLEKTFANNIKGFESMMQWLESQKIQVKESVFCFEHTGSYGLLLFSWLSHRGIDYSVEPALQIKRSLGMTRGKNDKVDARRIATYAYTHRDQLKVFEFPAKQLLKIKQRLTYRDQLVRTITSFKNSYKSHRQYEQVIHEDFISKEIEQTIAQFIEKVDCLDNQIKEIILADEELSHNFNLAVSVKGIGLIIAAFMLVTTNNFGSFENARKYSCYAGIAPFELSSGIFKGKARVNHLANKKMKSLLSNGANSAIRFDPEIKAYYRRKIEEGKDHKLIINAISCKLVNRVFAIIKRGTPYVTTFGNNFA